MFFAPLTTSPLAGAASRAPPMRDANPRWSFMAGDLRCEADIENIIGMN